MEAIHQHREDLVSRIPVFAIVVAVMLAVIAASFGRVQIARGGYYRHLADNNHLRQLPLRASRGLIYDRGGNLLVENTPSYSLLYDRGRVADRTASLAFAAGILGRPAEELETRLEKARGVPEFRPVRLAGHLSLAQVARLAVANYEHPEFGIDVEHLRLYRHESQTGHLLGYLGEVSEAEMAAEPDQYSPGDRVGKRGVEKVYEGRLRGSEGWRQVVVDSRGQILEEHQREPAEGGHRLNLTLDLGLQQEAERRLRGHVGAIVALDPDSGEVLALVSSPGYDPNLFSRGLKPGEWRRLAEAEHDPLQNRALQNTYPAGSIFKMVVAVAGLAEGIVDPDERVYCRGWTTLHNHRFHCGRRWGHGWVDLEQALAGSCNVYFYQLGQKLGIERIAAWARRFGLGELTGIDLPGEKSGLVPDPAWSLARRGTPWFPGETVSLAVGQGALLVTPLQIARLTAAVANGGRLVTPHVSRDHGPTEIRDLELDPRVLAPVRRGLEAVVNHSDGTAYLTARLGETTVAGKTGTAQVMASKEREPEEEVPWSERPHAWFASFAPMEGPRLVVVVFVEHGGAGSTVAAPIAKALYETYLVKPSVGRLPAL